MENHSQLFMERSRSQSNKTNKDDLLELILVKRNVAIADSKQTRELQLEVEGKQTEINKGVGETLCYIHIDMNAHMTEGKWLEEQLRSIGDIR